MNNLVWMPLRVLQRFLDNHGIALGSNIAFSFILSFFPFLLLITAMLAIVGGETIGARTQEIFVAILPDGVASVLRPEVDAVLKQDATSLLSLGIIVFLVTLTGAVESLREGLNRSYGIAERRSFMIRRLGGLLFVLCAGLVLILVTLALIAAPLVFELALPHFPFLQDMRWTFDLVRIGASFTILLAFVSACHILLPARKIPLASLWPGVLLTLLLWWVAGNAYSYYITHFATYAKVYAGLAGMVTTLIFLHIIASLFLLGAEINAVLMRIQRKEKLALRQATNNQNGPD
ncbi:MAG: YihY/virulence factor BrkB family protein [Cohaesibacteraceae bacterium]|nr:YihY/virulence factor BrkB family protein [Cohaesibacteraceae bacterium]